MSQRNTIIKREENRISMRFGFLGLGMGGSSIAAACGDIVTNIKNDRYPYSALLVNTNEIDLEKVSAKNPYSKKIKIGNGKGAGRNLELGEKMFKEDVDQVLDELKSQFENKDFIWVVAGLGGGTGTGSVIEAIKLLMENGYQKRFGLILTLPRLSEGKTVLNNALNRLKMIHGAMRGLGSIILVDNEKLYKDFANKNPEASVSEYLDFSNQFVADTLHELNVVTASFTPAGEYHFDSSEFENLLKTPGVLHFARFATKPHEIDSAQNLSHIGRLKEQLENGVLSEGYDLSETKRLAISILANEPTASRIYNFQFAQAIEDEISNLAPIASEKPIAQYVYQNKNINDVYFYAAFAGLDLPSRIQELVAESIRLNKLEEDKKQSNLKNVFAGFNDLNSVTNDSVETASFDDLFGSQATDSPTAEEQTSNEELFNNLFKNQT